MIQKRAFLRSHLRKTVVLPARARSCSGFLDRVVITDISEMGCRFQSQALTLRRGDLVVIRPEGMEGLCGVVRWVKNHKAGVQFDRPLYSPVVEHLFRRHHYFRSSIAEAGRELVRQVA